MIFFATSLRLLSEPPYKENLCESPHLLYQKKYTKYATPIMLFFSNWHFTLLYILAFKISTFVKGNRVFYSFRNVPVK